MTQTFSRETDDNDLSVRLEPMTAQELFHTPGLVEDESVGLILTDPPYIISRKTGFRNEGEDGTVGGNPQYAVNYEFGEWDTENGFSMADLNVSLQGCFRALKENGVAIVFFDLWKASELVEMMEKIGFRHVAMIEWVKTNAVPINSRKNYLSNAREIAIVGVKPALKGASDEGFVSEDTNADGTFHYPIYSGKDRFHSTQKSLPLFEELILKHSRKGDVVLDCFSGSGTTGVAAIRHGRHYIGAEPDCDPASETSYFSKSANRLDAAFKAACGK